MLVLEAVTLLGATREPAAKPVGVYVAKPLIARGLACAEGAFRRVGVNDAEAERLLSIGIARLMAARAVLEAAEHEARMPQDEKLLD